MAKINIKDTVSKATESVKEATNKIDIQGFADSVKSVTKKVDVQGMADSVKETAKKSTEQVKTTLLKKNTDEDKKAEEDNKQIEMPVVSEISSINAVKVIYFLMSADGVIEKSEEDKFNVICKEIDLDFEQHKDKIIEVCKTQLAKVTDSADYYDVIQDGVEQSLMVGQNLEKGSVTAKQLVWNLISIAYSDDKYDETERKLIKYIVRKLNISKDVFLEMESTYLTIMDIEKEKNWIKTTDRPYLTIETQVKELEKREEAIFESVKALIYL